MKISTALKALAGAAVVLLPLTASAESTFQTGPTATALTSTARVDFQVTIPKILYLRVGTGSSYATGVLTTVGTIDLLTFAPAAGVVGNGTAVAANAGGDAGVGIETAAIVSNSGDVTLIASTVGALTDGAAGDTIAFSQITTAAAGNSAGYTLLSAPVLANGASAPIVLTAGAPKVIKADAKWTYSYANTTTPPAGTYGGVVANNSRVTYTATMP
jgi:hypothetical protein